MKFYEKVKAISGIIKGSHNRSADSRSGSFAEMGGISNSGITVNEESSLRFSAVYNLYRLWTELPASLPIEIIEDKGDKRVPVTDHPAKQVLLFPNDYTNGFGYQEMDNGHMQLWGNGVSLIANRNRGVPEKLISIHPSSVTAVMEGGKIFYKIRDRLTGISGTFFSEEVVHQKMISLNGVWGKGVIQVARENIGLGLAAEKYGATFFKKGGNLKSVIETEGHIPDKEFKEWKKRWDENYAGERGNHETPLLEWGMKYKALGIPPEQAQFILTRQFSLQDMCRWFNTPPHMIGDLSRSTFSNIEHSDLQFVKYCLRPVLKRREAEYERKLLSPKEWGRIKIRYNLDAMLRGDLASLTNHIHQMVLDGVMTPNEGRRLLNLNPLPGGDVPYKPANIMGNDNATVNNKKELEQWLQSVMAGK